MFENVSHLVAHLWLCVTLSVWLSSTASRLTVFRATRKQGKMLQSFSPGLGLHSQLMYPLPGPARPQKPGQLRMPGQNPQLRMSGEVQPTHMGEVPWSLAILAQLRLGAYASLAVRALLCSSASPLVLNGRSCAAARQGHRPCRGLRRRVYHDRSSDHVVAAGGGCRCVVRLRVHRKGGQPLEPILATAAASETTARRSRPSSGGERDKDDDYHYTSCAFYHTDRNHLAQKLGYTEVWTDAVAGSVGGRLAVMLRSVVEQCRIADFKCAIVIALLYSYGHILFGGSLLALVTAPRTILHRSPR